MLTRIQINNRLRPTGRGAFIFEGQTETFALIDARVFCDGGATWSDVSFTLQTIEPSAPARDVRLTIDNPPATLRAAIERAVIDGHTKIQFAILDVARLDVDAVVHPIASGSHGPVVLAFEAPRQSIPWPALLPQNVGNVPYVAMGW